MIHTIETFRAAVHSALWDAGYPVTRNDSEGVAERWLIDSHFRTNSQHLTPADVAYLILNERAMVDQGENEADMIAA